MQGSSHLDNFIVVCNIVWLDTNSVESYINQEIISRGMMMFHYSAAQPGTSKLRYRQYCKDAASLDQNTNTVKSFSKY